MELLEDGLLAFFAAAGVAGCVWLIFGALLGCGRCRNPEILLVLPVRGAANAMEADLRDLLRVRRQMPLGRVVLADCGLNEEARVRAEYLCARFPGVVLKRAEKPEDV